MGTAEGSRYSSGSLVEVILVRIKYFEILIFKVIEYYQTDKYILL